MQVIAFQPLDYVVIQEKQKYMCRCLLFTKSLVSLLGFAVLASMSGLATAQGRVIRVTTTEAHRAVIEQTEWAVGIIESRRSPQVAAEVAGEVIRVHVDEGQGVEAGQVLAEIETEILVP